MLAQVGILGGLRVGMVGLLGTAAAMLAFLLWDVGFRLVANPTCELTE